MKVYSVFKIFMIFIVFSLSCETDSSTFPTNISNDLTQLEIKFIDGFGLSDFLGIPPQPDPVRISFSLEFKNSSISDTIRELYFKNCKVFLTTDSLLGIIEIIPWDDIDLLPSSTDTITFGKIPETVKIFDPPCGETFYLTFEIKDKYENFLNFKTDTIYYECDG